MDFLQAYCPTGERLHEISAITLTITLLKDRKLQLVKRKRQIAGHDLKLKDILYEIGRQLKAPPYTPNRFLSGQDFLEVYAKYITIRSRV